MSGYLEKFRIYLKRYGHLFGFLLLFIGFITLTEPECAFADEKSNKIENLISYDLIAPDLQKNYSANITRAEFTDVLVRIYEKAADVDKLSDEIPDKYTDISTSPYKASIKKASFYGLISYSADNQFKPDSILTRAQCAVMVYNTMKILGADLSVGSVSEPKLSDVAKKTSLTGKAIQYCVKAGFIKSASGDVFLPKGKLTRTQSFDILYAVARNCGFFRENTKLSDFRQLDNYYNMLEDDDYLYYVYNSIRRIGGKVLKYIELYRIDKKNGEREIYHKFNVADFPIYQEEDMLYSFTLVAMDDKYFYIEGGNEIKAVDRKTYEAKVLTGTEAMGLVTVDGYDLYYLNNKQIRTYSIATGKSRTIITFKDEILYADIHIVGNTLYVICADTDNYREGKLYRVDLDGSSISYLGSAMFRRLFFHKDGILAECYQATDNEMDPEIYLLYEFGYGANKMTYKETKNIAYYYQVLDGVLYSSTPYIYSVLKSKTEQSLGITSEIGLLTRQCGDYVYTFWDETYYIFNLRTGHYITNEYGDKRDNIQAYIKMEEMVKKLIQPSMTDVEKAKVITDWICKNAQYDYDCYYERSLIPSPESYSAVGFFYDGLMVCSGYAELTTCMFKLAGLDCFYAMGDSPATNEGHAWLYVNIGGKYYIVDTTWDDSTQESKRRYDYFLIAAKNYPNIYSTLAVLQPDLNTLELAEEDYPLEGIIRGEYYYIP